MPTHATWGYNNRGVAVRVPVSGAGGPPPRAPCGGRRRESLPAVAAVVLAGMLHGIENKLAAPDALIGNAYSQRSRHRGCRPTGRRHSRALARAACCANSSAIASCTLYELTRRGEMQDFMTRPHAARLRLVPGAGVSLPHPAAPSWYEAIRRAAGARDRRSPATSRPMSASSAPASPDARRRCISPNAASRSCCSRPSASASAPRGARAGSSFRAMPAARRSIWSRQLGRKDARRLWDFTIEGMDLVREPRARATRSTATSPGATCTPHQAAPARGTRRLAARIRGRLRLSLARA